jgi:hypothetical protein
MGGLVLAVQAFLSAADTTEECMLLRKKLRNSYISHNICRASSVGIATGYGLVARSSIPDKIRQFSLLQAGSGVHPLFCPMGTEALSSGLK